MKGRSLNSDTEEMCVGYYNNNIICMHKDKEVVQTYLMINRGLEKDEFKIRRESISNLDLCTKYDYYIIYEYYDHFIPNIDSIIIDINCGNLDSNLNNTIENLKQMLFMISHIEKDKEEINTLVNALKILMSYKKKKKYKKLYKESIVSNPILFCNINEYLGYITSFKQSRLMDTKYRDAWLSDN